MKKINLKEEIDKLNIDIKDFEKYIKSKVNTDVNTFLKSNFIFQLGFFIEYFILPIFYIFYIFASLFHFFHYLELAQ